MPGNLYDAYNPFVGTQRNIGTFMDLYERKQQRGLQERGLGLEERRMNLAERGQGVDEAYKQMLINKETEELKMKRDLMSDPGTRISIMSKAMKEAYATGGKKMADMTLKSFQSNPKYQDDTKGYTIDDFQFTKGGGMYAPIITTEGQRLEGMYGFIDPQGQMHELDMRPKQGSKPSSVEEYEFAKQLPAEEKAQFEKFATKPQTTINLGTSKKFLEELGKTTAESFTKQRESAQLSVQSIQNIQDARKNLDAGMYTGAGANVKLGFDKWLKTAGIDIGGERTANTEAFAGATGRLVGKIIKDFGSGTGLSDADRQYAERIAGGDITLTKQSIKKLFDISEKAQRIQIRTYNDLASQVESKYGKEEMPFGMQIQEPEEAKEKPSLDNIFKGQ